MIAAPKDLSRCTNAELEELAAEAHELEISARIELHQRGPRSTAAMRMAGKPVWKIRLVEALDSGDPRRTFSTKAITIAILVALLLSAPAIAKFGGAMLDRYMEAKQLQDRVSP